MFNYDQRVCANRTTVLGRVGFLVDIVLVIFCIRLFILLVKKSTEFSPTVEYIMFN